MSIVEIAFLGFSAVTIGGAAFLALTRNIIHAVFLLFVVLFGVAGLYVLFGAEFLAVSQVIVYVGGILVLLIFGVMLTHKLRDFKPSTQIVNKIPGLLAAGGMFAVFVAMVRTIDFEHLARPVSTSAKAYQPVAGIDTDVERIGAETLTEYLLPFEAISVLLLAVLIGAAYLSRKAKAKEARQ